MMTDINGALFPLSKNFLGTVKDPAWMVSAQLYNLLSLLMYINVDTELKFAFKILQSINVEKEINLQSC